MLVQQRGGRDLLAGDIAEIKINSHREEVPSERLAHGLHELGMKVGLSELKNFSAGDGDENPHIGKVKSLFLVLCGADADCDGATRVVGF